MGGDSIGRALLVEWGEQDSSAINEIIEVLQHHSGFECLWPIDEQMLSLPGLEIYPSQRKVYCGKQEVNLTAKEYGILCLLVVNKGRVLTYDQIYQRVWGEDVLGDERNAVKCHIRNLREKLHKAAPKVSFDIRCIREIGYRLEVASE